MIKYIYNFKIIVFLFIFQIACSQEKSDSKSIDTNKSTKAITVKQFKNISPQNILVGAHRAGGNKAGLPENSMAAIRKSLANGVDIIEIDVRITADSKIVVLHDKTLERTTNGIGKVSHQKLSDLKKLFLKDHTGAITTERIPTLEEVLLEVGDKAILFLDKSEPLLEWVIPIIKKTKSASNVLFIGFMNYAQAHQKYGDLLKESYYIPGIHDTNENFNEYNESFIQNMKPHPAAFAFWFKKESSQSFAYIKKAQELKIPIWINTTTEQQSAGHTDALSLTDPDAGWGWIIKQGANIIFTDEPEALIDYLKSKNLRAL